MSSFNNNIPQPSDRIDVSQNDLLQNNAQLDTSFGVDHFPFSSAVSNGKHKQITMPVQSSPPPSTVSGEGVLYTSANSGTSDLYYARDNSANTYQITRIDNSKYAEFATNTNYAGTAFGGWTYLPGGMLLQYGLAISSGTSLPNAIVLFPKEFTNVVYSVNCTVLETSDTRRFVSVFNSTKAQFTATLRDSGGSKTSGIRFYWQAIGV